MAMMSQLYWTTQKATWMNNQKHQGIRTHVSHNLTQSIRNSSSALHRGVWHLINDSCPLLNSITNQMNSGKAKALLKYQGRSILLIKSLWSTLTQIRVTLMTPNRIHRLMHNHNNTLGLLWRRVKYVSNLRVREYCALQSR